MGWLLRIVLAGSGLLAGVAGGFLFASSLRGETIERPLRHPWQPLDPGATWTYEDRGHAVFVERLSGILLDGARIVADVTVEGSEAGARTIVLDAEGVHDADGLTLPTRVAPGQRWIWRGEGVTATAQAVGVERLEVPAGVFETLHVRREVTRDGVTRVDDLYYAKGVGLVAAPDRRLKGFSPGAR